MITVNPDVLLLYRVRRGLSREALAKRVGVAASSIGRAESKRGVSAKTVKALSDFFEIDPAQLLAFGGESNGSISSIDFS